MVRCSAWNKNGRRCKLHTCGLSDTCYVHGTASATASAPEAEPHANVIVQEPAVAAVAVAGAAAAAVAGAVPYMYSQEQLLWQKKRNQELWASIIPSLDSSTLEAASTMNQNNYWTSATICANVMEEKLPLQEQSQSQSQSQQQSQPTLIVQEEEQSQEEEQQQQSQEAVACGHICHFNNVICCGCNDLRPQVARCDAVIGGIVVPNAGQRREDYCAECRNAYEIMPYERQTLALITAFPATHSSDIGATACFTLCAEIQGAIQKLIMAHNALYAHATTLQLWR